MWSIKQIDREEILKKEVFYAYLESLAVTCNSGEKHKFQWYWIKVKFSYRRLLIPEPDCCIFPPCRERSYNLAACAFLLLPACLPATRIKSQPTHLRFTFLLFRRLCGFPFDSRLPRCQARRERELQPWIMPLRPNLATMKYPLFLCILAVRFPPVLRRHEKPGNSTKFLFLKSGL